MADIECTQVGQVDRVMVRGVLDEDHLNRLATTISTLRQKKSKKLLLIGGEVDRIELRHLELLAKAIKNYRVFGGIFSLAEWNDDFEKHIRNATWYKYVNVFKTEQEALQFLEPDHRK